MYDIVVQHQSFCQQRPVLETKLSYGLEMKRVIRIVIYNVSKRQRGRKMGMEMMGCKIVYSVKGFDVM